MRSTRWLCVVVSLLLAVGSAGIARAQEEGEKASDAVFRGEVDVNVVNVFVSVVDARNRPVVGLDRSDFKVSQDGDPVEITNLTGVAPGEAADVIEARSEVGREEAAPVAPGSFAERSYVALLFDNASLERRARKKVLKSLEPFVDQLLADGREVMVATTGTTLDIVQPHTGDRQAVLAALETVSESDATGDMMKSSKRMLIRSIQEAQSVRHTFDSMGSTITRSGSGGSGGSSGGSGGNGGTGGTGGSQGSTYQRPASWGVETEYGGQQSQQYLHQINMLRQSEYQRIFQSLIGLDTVIRGMSGLAGRKDVIFIGEDLLLRPAIDVYQAFYTKFEKWSSKENIDRPEVWSSELELSREFQYLAGSAQSGGTFVHVLDASDRDREAASADFAAPDAESFKASDAGGPGLTGGYDLAQARLLEEGSHYLASATGGAFFGSSRNFEGFFEALDGLLDAYYSIGYRPPGPLDGSLHSVKVEVEGPYQVKHHEKVASLSAYHRLANCAFSQLMLGGTDMPLDFEIELAGSEPDAEGKVIRTCRLLLPTDELLMEADGENRVARIAVAVVVAQPGGDVTPPKLFQMSLPVPAGQVELSSAMAASFRLLMEQGSPAMAVAVRDERSGLVGSRTLKLE